MLFFHLVYIASLFIPQKLILIPVWSSNLVFSTEISPADEAFVVVIMFSFTD